MRQLIRFLSLSRNELAVICENATLFDKTRKDLLEQNKNELADNLATFAHNAQIALADIEKKSHEKPSDYTKPTLENVEVLVQAQENIQDQGLAKEVGTCVRSIVMECVGRIQLIQSLQASI